MGKSDDEITIRVEVVLTAWQLDQLAATCLRDDPRKAWTASERKRLVREKLAKEITKHLLPHKTR